MNEVDRADTVLLVLAAEGDAAAAAFAARRRDAGVRLLHPADLSIPGWSYRVGDAAGSVAMVDGASLPARRVRGVLTRLEAVGCEHLPHVVEADRAYVAAEMTAFLLAWLSALPCPVFNRPLPPSLAGPAWAWARWARLAAQRGVPVASTVPDASHEADPANETKSGRTDGGPYRLDILDGEALRSGRPALVGHAVTLARAAGMSLLGLTFDADRDDALLTGVDPWPNVADPAVADALLARMR